VLRSLLGIPLLCVALAVELAIATMLVDSDGYIANIAHDVDETLLIGIHLVVSLLAAVCISSLLNRLIPGRRLTFIFTLFLLSVFMPFLGAAGSWLALTFGAIMAKHRHKDNVFWQFTGNADLPFAAPIGRPHPKLDGRGYVEQLIFDTDEEAVYSKVVASKNIRDSQSGDILKTAIGHKNERIRLLAYQMLDKKVNHLNRQIQRLESEAQNSSGIGKANIHLQIANNYWELLTLEGDEPVARQQLLEAAAGHVKQTVDIQPQNVNGYFLLGQIALKQGEMGIAIDALEQAESLGMSKDKIIPYRAEVAFVQRDFTRLRELMAGLSPSFRAYPPLSKVAEFWA